jgi:hypothetical protein
MVTCRGHGAHACSWGIPRPVWLGEAMYVPMRCVVFCNGHGATLGILCGEARFGGHGNILGGKNIGRRGSAVSPWVQGVRLAVQWQGDIVVRQCSAMLSCFIDVPVRDDVLSFGGSGS